MSRWLVVALALGSLVGPAWAQKSPEETVKSLTVADGLQVELFAAEPMLINPTSIDVDHLGRVWVCEAVNYRRKNFGRPILRDAGDRIVVLADTNGDGKADESTVFYQGQDLIAPLGIAVAATAASPPRKGGESSFSYKVFVCQSPDILLFEDRDGDGKADGPPKKFLTGFRGVDHDHGVHGINIGPDGKLYFTVGDSGVDGLQSSDGKGLKYRSNNTDCRAGTVWRCDMDGTNLELIAHNFRNNYECCVNSFGEVWLSDNDDDGNQQTRICFVMPGGNYGYHPRGPGQTHWHEEQPGVVHKAMRTGFGSPTGICFYEGNLLPKKYHGQLLHTDAGPRELRAFHLKPKGAGYELEKENLVTSTDNWFRLADVCVAPDGSLMLADWYDPGVGGHGMGDWTRGRIYRVTPKGHQGYKVPAVNVDSTEGILAALGNPALSVQHIARSALKGMSSEQRASIAKQATTQRDDSLLRVRALWTVEHDDPDRNTMFGAAYWDRDERFRVWDARWTGLTDRKWVDDHWHELFTESRMSPAVLREVLVQVLRNEDVAIARKLFGNFARQYDGQDHFYRAALNIALGTDPKRREAILADFDRHFPEWNDKVADLVWELRPASVLPRLGTLLEDSKLTAAQKGRIVDILAVNDDLAAGKVLLGMLGRDLPAEMKARALENLRLNLPTKWNALAGSNELASAVKTLLADEKARTTGLQLVAAARYGAGRDAVAAIAANREMDLPTRTEAVRTLGQLRSPESLQALMSVGTPENPLSVECVRAIGQMLPTGPKADPTGQMALDALKQAVLLEKGKPELKAAALGALAGNRAGTLWLLEAREQNRLPETLVADAGRLLRNSPFQGERNKALLLFPAPGKLDPKKLPSASVLAQKVGDVKRGEALFLASMKSEAQCLRCHMVRGVGGNIGPDISMIGKKGSKENLYDSLLTPSKAIADQYLQWKVDSVDGRSVTGLLIEETDARLTLRDANGKDHTFAVKDLDGPKQKSLVSLMPDNLVAALTEDELIDMVEYLMTLQTASMSPERWLIAGPFPGGNNNVGLDTDHGPIGTPFDPKATFKGRDGQPVAWRTILPTGTGYIDLAAFHGDAGNDSVSYLYAEIESPVAQDGAVLLGSDDGVKLYVNGELRHKEKVTRAAAPEQARVPVKLKQGKNAILVQIANGNNPHGLYFALTSDQELKPAK